MNLNETVLNEDYKKRLETMTQPQENKIKVIKEKLGKAAEERALNRSQEEPKEIEARKYTDCFKDHFTDDELVYFHDAFVSGFEKANEYWKAKLMEEIDKAIQFGCDYVHDDKNREEWEEYIEQLKTKYNVS